jgi:hypothetical protein
MSVNRIKLTDEIIAKLVGIAKASGLDLGVAAEGTDIGDLKPVIPPVNLNRATSEIAHETAMNLKSAGLYVYAGRLITVAEDGKEEDMDADRFRTWIDQFQLNFYKRRKKSDDDDSPGVPVKATLKADVAKVMLRSDEFICHLPVIKRILPVRLPVWEKEDNGSPKVRLLPYGYDQETQIYTQNTGVHYVEIWTLEEGVKYMRDLLKDFPYGDQGRSLSVQIAAMLTMYCHLLLGDRDRSPMIYFNANQPGSGKSRLAEMCIYPIYGSADPLTYADNDEFTKKLDTWAQANELYAFLDDVSGLVKSNDLNRWITSPTWSGRVMHSQKSFSVYNQKLTLLTGNQATLSEDLTRRSLMVDLWSSELATDRQTRLEKVIDAEWLAQTENRGHILSALFAMVRHWVTERKAEPHKALLPSFEGWSRVVPSIVTAAGFACPLEKPTVQDAGGKQQVEFLRLLEAAVGDYTPEGGMEIGKPVDILLTDWCRLARKVGVFHAVISDTVTMREEMDKNPKLYKPVKDENGVPRELSEEDKNYQASRFMDKGQSTKFGGLLNKFYRGQIRTIQGRRYQFADREAKYSTFAILLLAEELGENDPF